MVLLLRDTLEVEFWKFEKDYSWRYGNGEKLFTISNALHHTFERDIARKRGRFYIGSAILSVDLFNDYFNEDMDARYHLTIKGSAWNTDSEKSTPIVMYVPFAKIVGMAYKSTNDRVITTDMHLEIDYGIKVINSGNDVIKVKIEMVEVEEEE